MLHIIVSTFTVQTVQHLNLQAIHIKYRKTLTFANRVEPICTAASPLFNVHVISIHKQRLHILLII